MLFKAVEPFTVPPANNPKDVLPAAPAEALAVPIVAGLCAQLVPSQSSVFGPAAGIVFPEIAIAKS